MSVDPNSEHLRDYSLHLRDVLEQVNVSVAPCGPGEPQDCGNSHAHHAVSYLAALKARAEYGLRHMYHGDPAGEALAEQLYEHWLAEFTSEGCTDGNAND